MTKTKTKKDIDMINGPLLGKLIVFTIPVILSGILQLLFNAADLVVIGQFAGKHSLAAVGSNSSLINLIINLFVGLSVGANVIMARAIGERRKEKAERVVHTAMMLAFTGGIIFAVIGFFLSGVLLKLMNVDANVIDKSTLYLKIYFLGVPASGVYNFGAAMLRAKGDTKRPLYFLFAAGVINVLFNLLFVIVFGMDVAGVALATIISQYISAILIIVCLLREKEYCKMSFKKLRFFPDEVREIIAVGFPAGLYSSLFSLSNIFIQTAVNGFGDTVMAGNSTAANIEGFVYIAMNAFYHASISFVGQNCGAHRYKRVKTIFWDCMLLVTIVGLVFGMVFWLLGGALSSLYSSEAEVIEYSVLRLSIIMPTYFLCGIMEVTVGTLRGMGRSVQSMVVALIWACGLRIVWIFTVFAAVPTLPVLYSCFPVSWVLTTLVNIIIFFVLYKKLALKDETDLPKEAAVTESAGEESVTEIVYAETVEITDEQQAEILPLTDQATETVSELTPETESENEEKEETDNSLSA